MMKSSPEATNHLDKSSVNDSVDFALEMENAVAVKLVDTDLYLSKELRQPTIARGAFGGQIVAQSLYAAWDTVDEAFTVHSLHTYFIRAASVKTPVLYKVQRVRDGKSFATRIVRATQKGKDVFICSLSFTRPETETPMNHQARMPDVPSPETLPTDMEILQKAIDNVKTISKEAKRRTESKLKDYQPIEYRETVIFTDEEVASGYTKPNPRQRRWFKTKGKLNDDMKIHTCALVYASDNEFISAAGAAHGYTFKHEGVQLVTSLDHTIWFHTPARADDWLLYDIYSSRLSTGRGVVFGRMYSRDGTLVATTAQEGLIRLSETELGKLHSAQQELQKETLKNLNNVSKL